MTEEIQRSRVTFECAKDKKWDFENIKKIVRPAYQTIGVIGPFDHDYEKTMFPNKGIIKASATDYQDMILPFIL